MRFEMVFLLVFEMLNIGKNSYFYGHMTHTVEGDPILKKSKIDYTYSILGYPQKDQVGIFVLYRPE